MRHHNGWMVTILLPRSADWQCRPDKKSGQPEGRPLFLSIRGLSVYCFRRSDLHRRQPAEAIRLEAIGDGEELIRDLLRYLAHLSFANDDAVNRTNGRDFGRRACKEHLVGAVKQFARKRLFEDGLAELTRNRQHA